MTRFTFLASVCALCFSSSVLAKDRPNVVIVLADDFGVGDIQVHYPENKIATPHLDRLVREGMSFHDAHSSSAVCSPTRYGLLTGRYNWRTRLQEWVIAAYEPPLIEPGRPTLPGLFQHQGYHTACIGKWHLGWDWPGAQTSRMTEQRNGQAFLEWDFTQPIRGGPIERGFDYFFGVDLPNLPPFTYIENDRTSPLPTADFRPDPQEGIVLPTRFAGTPAAPGWKMQNILPTITERAVQYIHEQAEQDTPFFLYFSLTSPHEPVVPSASFRGRSKIAPIADFVMETDWSVGQVLEAIDHAGVADETVVIFTADNGHSHYTGWPQLIAAGHQPSGPLRGHKGDIWEGGHRVPLVVRWPDRVAPQSQSQQLVCLTDFFATCADLLDTELPVNGAEDSVSFLSCLLGESSETTRTSLVSHSNFGEFAYRDGPWKLVFKLSDRNLERSRGKPTITELYDLEHDIAEEHDLSQREADVVTKLTRDFQRLIDAGATRPDLETANDADVDFRTTQERRWVAARTASAAAAERSMHLRVLSYNIHHGEGIDGVLDLERIALVIQSARPDLVALQEVERNARRTGVVDQPAELARLTKMHAAFGANIEFQDGHYGNAVLSRFPILRQENHLLPNVDEGEQRGMLEVVVELPGDVPLVLLATHLDHRRDDRERRASADWINAWVGERSGQLAILAGDLNDTPGSETLTRFIQKWSHTNRNPLPTIPVTRPTRQIDYVLCRPEHRWKTIDVQVLDEAVASDHRAILAVLEILPVDD